MFSKSPATFLVTGSRLRQVPILQNITRVTKVRSPSVQVPKLGCFIKDSLHVTLSRSARMAPSFSAPSQSERTSLTGISPRATSVLPNQIPCGSHHDRHPSITLKSLIPAMTFIQTTADVGLLLYSWLE